MSNNIHSQKQASEFLSNDLNKLTELFNSLKKSTSEIALETHDAVKTLREKLQDTTFRFYSVIDSISDIVIIKDSDGKWQTVNSAAKKLYGFNNQEYIGKTDYDLSIEFPMFKESLNICIASDERAWKNKAFHREIESFDFKDRTLYFDVIKNPRFNEDGTRKELIVIGRDITEIKEKEYTSRALMNALNTSSDNIFIIDEKGRITYCNDTFISLFKFKNLNDALGSSIKNLGLTEIYDEMFSVIQTNMVWTDVIKTVIHEEPITGLFTIIPMMNGKPNPILYICTLKLY